MKKKSIKDLKLEKTTISKLNAQQVTGGTGEGGMFVDVILSYIFEDCRGGGSAGICTGEDPLGNHDQIGTGTVGNSSGC